MLRGIAAGYCIPTADNLRNIFWSKPSQTLKIHLVASEGGRVSWHRIWPENDAEREQMEYLMTDIFMSLGPPVDSAAILEEFATKWGLTGKNLGELADQLHNQIQHDAKTLHEIRQRIKHVYPSEIKWTDDLDNEQEKTPKQNYAKLHESVAIADNKFQVYSECISSKSKSSKTFSLVRRLTFLCFGDQSTEWEYPAIEIV